MNTHEINKQTVEGFRSGLSAEGTLISASAICHCRAGLQLDKVRLKMDSSSLLFCHQLCLAGESFRSVGKLVDGCGKGD